MTVWPLSLRIPTIAPASVGGNLTPVDALDVVMVFQTAESCKASAAVVPTATRSTAPSPAIETVESGEFPAESMREGIAIVIPNQTAMACLSSG